MAKAPKQYKIKMTKSSMRREDRTYFQEGTLPELVEAYSYTLECGASWSHEKGRSKINRNPKSIKTLISNLNKAVDNTAANGYSGKQYELVEE